MIPCDFPNIFSVMNRDPVDDAAGRGHVEEAGLGVDHSVEESLGEKIHRDMEAEPKEVKTVR